MARRPTAERMSLMSRYDSLFPMPHWDDHPRRQFSCCKSCFSFCHEQPKHCCDDAAIKVRLFDKCSCGYGFEHALEPACAPVTIVNPWNCREKVLVSLSIDECGNLVVCIKR